MSLSKKYGRLHKFMCHSCAGAMLIFHSNFSVCVAEATTGPLILDRNVICEN